MNADTVERITTHVARMKVIQDKLVSTATQLSLLTKQYPELGPVIVRLNNGLVEHLENIQDFFWDVKEINQALMLVTDVALAYRSYILTGDVAFLEKANSLQEEPQSSETPAPPSPDQTQSQ